jgi:DNA-binding NarL/FixJ family response regulator
VPVVKLYVLDPHTIYRRGLVVCLEAMPEVESVAHAASIDAAREDPALADADLAIVDPLVADVFETTGARVMVCTSDCTEQSVLAAIRAGAVGYLRKDTLTPEILAAAVTAAAKGTGVMEPELFNTLIRGVPDRARMTRLNERELQVLSLIAAGHPTREVAKQLCYSERTVKNVLHDVVTKLNARSRSQAVAYAVREGLI